MGNEDMKRALMRWSKIEGLRFWSNVSLDGPARPHEFFLEVGIYDNKRVAISVNGPNGPEAKLTVNLHDVPLDDGQFFVRKDTMRFAWHLFVALTAIGLIEEEERTVVFGGHDASATLWQITRCPDDADKLSAECSHCVDRMVTEHKAKDAARRLDAKRPLR